MSQNTRLPKWKRRRMAGLEPEAKCFPTPKPKKRDKEINGDTKASRRRPAMTVSYTAPREITPVTSEYPMEFVSKNTAVRSGGSKRNVR